MKLKKKVKPGVCAANRCTATEGLRPHASAAGVHVCERHVLEPIDGGAPAPAPSQLVPVEVKATVVQPIEAEALALRAKLTTLPIKTAAELAAAPGSGVTLEQAGALAAHLQTRIRETKAAQDRATGHLKAAKREIANAQSEIKSWFDPALQAFEAVKSVVHAAMAEFTTAQSQARQQALQAGDHGAAMAVEQAALPAGTHERKRVLWRVTDPAAVPREFLAVDAARVQRVVDAQGLQTSIPGIEPFEETKLVTRGS